MQSFIHLKHHPCPVQAQAEARLEGGMQRISPHRMSLLKWDSWNVQEEEDRLREEEEQKVREEAERQRKLDEQAARQAQRLREIEERQAVRCDLTQAT